jgi:hypothetical protein
MLRNTSHPIPIYNPINNSSAERQPIPNQRKCSMCNKTGHNIKHCNDAASKNRLKEIETRFINAMKNRLSSGSAMEGGDEYNNLVHEVRDTVPKNLMKFAVIKFGGYSTALTTKLKLFGMFIFQMIRRFINHEYEFMENISRVKTQLLNAERCFWLWISSGNSIETSQRMYNNRVNEIIIEQDERRRNSAQAQAMALFPIKINLVTDLTESMDGSDTWKQSSVFKCNDTTETIPTFDCDICFDNKPTDIKVTFDCGHSFCGVCVQTTFEICKTSSKKPTCAMCRNEYTTVCVTSEVILSELQRFCK